MNYGLCNSLTVKELVFRIQGAIWGVSVHLNTGIVCVRLNSGFVDYQRVMNEQISFP